MLNKPRESGAPIKTKSIHVTDPRAEAVLRHRRSTNIKSTRVLSERITVERKKGEAVYNGNRLNHSTRPNFYSHSSSKFNPICKRSDDASITLFVMVIFRDLWTDMEVSAIKLLYAFHPTLFGKCLIAVTAAEKAVAHLVFVDGNEEQAVQIFKNKWRFFKVSKDYENTTKNIIGRIFLSDAFSPDSVCVLLNGTSFQVQVWKALTTIPKGTSITYQEFAKMIKFPPSTGPIAQAVLNNHIALMVPCHRVTGKTSDTYTWGLERKKDILKHERQSV